MSRSRRFPVSRRRKSRPTHKVGRHGARTFPPECPLPWDSCIALRFGCLERWYFYWWPPCSWCWGGSPRRWGGSCTAAPSDVKRGVAVQLPPQRKADRKNRPAKHVFAASLAIFAVAAIVLPGAYLPVASGGVLGVLFGLAWQWIGRPTSRQTTQQTGADPLNPGRTASIAVRLGLLLFGTSLVLFGRGPAQGADRPEKSSRASPPDYRVLVPIDAQRKPTGGMVYVPEAFYQELYRHAVPAEKPPAWLIVGATYRGELARDAAAGRLAIGTLRAYYDLRVFDRARRVRIPVGSEGAELLPGGVLLDGREIESQWEPDAAALTFELAEPGQYRLELSLRPTLRNAGDPAGIDLAIPRLAASRLELTLPTDALAVEVPSACGGVSRESDPPRLAADLGPADRLTVRWRQGASPGGANPAIDAEQLLWLKVQPGSVVIAAKFLLHAAEGPIEQVQLAVDPRLRLLPMSGDDPPSVQIASESGQTRVLAFRWPRPHSNRATLEATFLIGGASGVGNLRLPHLELLDVRSTRRWLAVSVDPALDGDQRPKEPPGAIPTANFLKLWGKADSKPQAAYRLPGGEIGWTISTRPHEPCVAADQTTTLCFDKDRVDVRL